MVAVAVVDIFYSKGRSQQAGLSYREPWQYFVWDTKLWDRASLTAFSWQGGLPNWKGGLLGLSPTGGWSPQLEGWYPQLEGWYPQLEGWSPQLEGRSPQPKGWSPQLKGWSTSIWHLNLGCMAFWTGAFAYMATGAGGWSPCM